MQMRDKESLHCYDLHLYLLSITFMSHPRNKNSRPRRCKRKDPFVEGLEALY